MNMRRCVLRCVAGIAALAMGVGMLPAGAMAADVLSDDGSGAAEASRPTTYDFIDKHTTSDWAITNGGGSDLRIDKQSQTLTFHTDKGWPKADLGTSAAGLEAPKAEWGNIYYEYDFAAVGSARIDLWSGDYLLVLSEAYGKTNSDGVVPGTYHGELSLADMIDKATIYPRQGSGFGAPLTDKSGIDMFHLDGVQVWAVGGDVTVRTLKMTGAPFEQAPQQPTRSLYDALYPTPIFQSHSEAGYSVDVNGNTVIVTNKRIDTADNVGWPSTGGTVDWTIDRNKTPYLYLDVHADDDLGKLSSAKPGWNVILTSKKNPAGVNMDRIFNANSNADAHQSQRVRVDLRDHNFDSLEENGRIDLTGISLMAVTDRFHKVEFRQAYIAAAPKQDDTKPYAEPVRFGEGKLNYRMPLTKAPTVQQSDYDINVADGETVRGEVDWTYTSKAGKALSVNVDGKSLAGGTGVPETPSFTMEDQGVTVGAFKGPAVLSGAGEDQPSYFTLSSPSTGWGKETVRLASQPAVDESGKTELLLASSDADGYFKLGSTAYGVVNHNDPHVRGIALTLPDGSVHTPIGINKYLFAAKGDVNYTIQHVAYGPQTSYALGDGYPAGSNPSIPPVIGFVFDLSNADLTPVIRTMRYHLDTMDLPDGKHTLELLEAGTVKKRLSFTVDNRAERQRESPVLSASDTRFNGAKAHISLTATSPTGKDMDVSLFTNNPLQVTGTALDDNGTDALTSGQMQGLTTGGEPIASHSSTTVPEHQFTVSVGDDTTGDVALSWKGSTDDGERVRMSVRNPKTSQWDIVADGQGAMQASAVVNIGTYAVNGSIKVKVQPVYVTNGSDTMLWMSDTQHYAYFQKFVPYYMGITQYAADQYKDGKIGYAAVTGDLVEQNDGANWPVADKAFATMDKAGVPMGVVAGNHDVGNHTASTGYESGNYANFQKYFGAKRYEGKDWWGGSRNNNINHYDLVTIGGYDFVMLYLGMGHEASDETVQWAHDVLAQYPQRNAIVLTHEYLSYKGEPYVDTYGSGNIQVGKDIFEKIVKPNKNIVMVLCGHESGAVTNVKQVDGRTVVEMLANYQTIDLSHSQESTDNYWTSNGDEFLRLLTFKDGKVSFTTYSPLLDRYNAYAPQIDTGEEQLDLRAPSRNLVTEGFSAIRLDKSAVSSSPSSAKVQQTLHSGQSMTVDIDMGSDSGWYAVLDDGRNKTITVLKTNTKTGGGSEQPSEPNGSSGNGGSGVDGPADAGRPAETEKNSSAASQQRLGYLSVTGATTAWVVALLTVLVSVGWLILRRRRRMVD